jgi:hypothetical protein
MYTTNLYCLLFPIVCWSQLRSIPQLFPLRLLLTIELSIDAWTLLYILSLQNATNGETGPYTCLLLPCIVVTVMVIYPSSFMFLSLCRCLQSFTSCLRVLTLEDPHQFIPVSHQQDIQRTMMSVLDSGHPCGCCLIGFWSQTRCPGCVSDIWTTKRLNTIPSQCHLWNMTPYSLVSGYQFFRRTSVTIFRIDVPSISCSLTIFLPQIWSVIIISHALSALLMSS